MADGVEDRRGAIAVLDIGAVDDQTDQQTQRIGDDMALAPVDLLARVIAPKTTAFSGFHALAVDHARRRAGLAALEFARRHDELMVDRGQQTTVSPVVEVALHR